MAFPLLFVCRRLLCYQRILLFSDCKSSCLVAADCKSAATGSAMEKINQAWQAASQDMYNAQQQAGGANPGAGFDPNNMGGNPGQQGGGSNQGGSDNVTDVDYEEVK